MTTNNILAHPANDKQIHKFFQLFKPWQWLTDPVFEGMDNIPNKGPVLFVGNHTLVGMWDAALMWYKLYCDKGIFTRALGDYTHEKVPLWRDLVRTFGLVTGTRENCDKLMQAGEYIMVFPGGSRECFKYKGEAYQLIWGERKGFARMAIKHGCTIVPFSAVGAEECYDLVMDSQEMAKTYMGKMMTKHFKLRQDHLFPIVKGVGMTPIPRPERLYFKFGKPIETTQYEGDYMNNNKCDALKAVVKSAVEDGIKEMHQKRLFDPKRNFINRMVSRMNPFNGRVKKNKDKKMDLKKQFSFV